MDFNVGGFSDSLKYSYQQFCKQDMEGREQNHRLLMKIKKFEAKSFHLMKETQTAQQMKNQYERMLMQQNPLLWAQLQRSLRLDLTDFDAENPLDTQMYSGLKCTKEVAINTSNDSLSSEQHSFNDGVWPHSPTPSPEVIPQTYGLTKIDKKTPTKINHSSHSNNLNIPKNEENVSTSNNSFQVTEKTVAANLNSDSPVRQPQLSTLDNVPYHLSPRTTNQVGFFPVTSSTPVLANKEDNQKPPNLEDTMDLTKPKPDFSNDQQAIITPPPATVIEEPVPEQPRITFKPNTELHTSNDSTGILTGSFNDNQIHDSNILATTEAQLDVPTEPILEKEIKPFRLESESEGAEDPSISGPPSGKNPGDEDSDSFWN